ncbi:MAG: hypothetical protein LBH81_03525 [Rickettsiales bacterium]|jgi:hypothetical protein|nr:hypothetical protein [Rickettsiales bacterium]
MWGCEATECEAGYEVKKDKCVETKKCEAGYEVKQGECVKSGVNATGKDRNTKNEEGVPSTTKPTEKEPSFLVKASKYLDDGKGLFDCFDAPDGKAYCCNYNDIAAAYTAQFGTAVNVQLDSFASSTNCQPGYGNKCLKANGKNVFQCIRAPGMDFIRTAQREPPKGLGQDMLLNLLKEEAGRSAQPESKQQESDAGLNGIGGDSFLNLSLTRQQVPQLWPSPQDDKAAQGQDDIAAAASASVEGGAVAEGGVVPPAAEQASAPVVKDLGLKDLKNHKLTEASRWVGADGTYNTKRYVVDGAAAVVLGTVGGFVVNSLMKSSQSDSGFGNVQCRIGDATVSGWRDSFNISSAK